jgi:hypothetical protein
LVTNCWERESNLLIWWVSATTDSWTSNDNMYFPSALRRVVREFMRELTSVFFF